MVVMLKKYWYILVIALSLGSNIILYYTEDESYIEKYEAKIEALEKKIDSIKTRNVGLKGEIQILEKKSDSLDDQIGIARDEKNKIIKSYEYYLKDILDLDDTELERWFISRYSDTIREQDCQTCGGRPY